MNRLSWPIFSIFAYYSGTLLIFTLQFRLAASHQKGISIGFPIKKKSFEGAVFRCLKCSFTWDMKLNDNVKRGKNWDGGLTL